LTLGHRLAPHSQGSAGSSSEEIRAIKVTSPGPAREDRGEPRMQARCVASDVERS